MLLGDGEFDGVAFQQLLAAQGWTYVCRTASNLPIRVDDEWLVLSDLAAPGHTVSARVDDYSNQDYSPLGVIAW